MANLNYTAMEIDALLGVAEGTGAVDGVVQSDGENSISKKEVDAAPTIDSQNLVESGGVAAVLKSSMANLNAAFVKKTVSGPTVTFADGAENIPMPSVVAQILPTQSGSGDPSPTNVRPIIGWTGANITVNGDVVAVPWQDEAGTVYGGEVDVKNGRVVSKWAKWKIKDLGWFLNTSGTYPFFQSTNTPPFYRQYGNNYVACLCDSYKVQATTLSSADFAASADDLVVNLNGGSTAMKIRDNRYATVADWLAAMGEAELCFEVRSDHHAETSITPQEISTALGSNSIAADTGDIAVTYCADTKLYIDSLL